MNSLTFQNFLKRNIEIKEREIGEKEMFLVAEMKTTILLILHPSKKEERSEGDGETTNLVFFPQIFL
jgi:hypothetical protein